MADRMTSGGGEAKMLPHAAASAIPRPTYPLKAGSCPDPPPTTMPTLLPAGDLLTTTRGSCMAMSGECASTKPSRASSTTSNGSLISFLKVTRTSLDKSSRPPIIPSRSCRSCTILQELVEGVEGGSAVKYGINLYLWADDMHDGLLPVLESLKRMGYDGVEVPIYHLNILDQGVRLVDEVGHPNCRLHLDTFHAHIEEKDPAAAIRRAGDRIAHVHISENDRGTPGTGSVRWDETFDSLGDIGYDGWLTVEAFGNFLPNLAAATKIWRPLFESEEQLARDALAFLKTRTGKPVHRR